MSARVVRPMSFPKSPISSLAEERPDFGPNGLLPRHRWYRFKEGFSAGLVSAFVAEHLPSSGGHLLDPFLGSGTTAVEGARLGHFVDGIETNPFMAFMARVKTRDYSDAVDIEAKALECISNRNRDQRFLLARNSTLVERKSLKKWLLNRSVAIRFEQIRAGIAEVRPAAVRDLLLLALLSCVEDAANARKDGKCLRYKTNWKRLAFDGNSLDEAFAAQVLRFVEDIKICPKLSGDAFVAKGDSRKLIPRIRQDGIRYDAVLTSPPYLNSFDYTDIYRPELLLMNAATDSTDLRKLRFNTLRSHVQVAWKPSEPLEIPLLQRKIKSIDEEGLWCGRIPAMINAYFVDLDAVVNQCSMQLKRDATAAFVVADSAYGGVVIPVGEILGEILSRRGFHVAEIKTFRHTLGNGHHQNRSSERLKEMMVVAEFRGCSK